jgi:hypothetical protein
VGPEAGKESLYRRAEVQDPETSNIVCAGARLTSAARQSSADDGAVAPPTMRLKLSSHSGLGVSA